MRLRGLGPSPGGLAGPPTPGRRLMMALMCAVVLVMVSMACRSLSSRLLHTLPAGEIGDRDKFKIAWLAPRRIGWQGGQGRRTPVITEALNCW